jgi:hypothetical protein
VTCHFCPTCGSTSPPLRSSTTLRCATIGRSPYPAPSSTRGSLPTRSRQSAQVALPHAAQVPVE